MSKFIIPKLQENVTMPFKSLKFNIPPLNIGGGGSKFTIPKINFGEKGQSLKLNKLSDVVSNHLSQSLQKQAIIKQSDKDIDCVTDSVENLQIKRDESVYSIDLSVALKSTPSGSSVKNGNKIISEEIFDIPFVDCDAGTENEKIRQCFFDIRHVLNGTTIILKPVSDFGKTLCTKYQMKSRPRLHSRTFYSKFNFGTPSPDDIVAKHLRR